MKKEPRAKKLVLNVETLGLLEGKQLQGVHGGQTTTVYQTTVSAESC